MKLGIMQPYIFPYIGYFQLINCVDKFVVYDDISFIKQGWINRNKILLNGADHIFTVPLKNASSFTTIRNTGINSSLYGQWQTKFLKTLTQAYNKAPFFDDVYDLVSGILSEKSDTISELAAKSLTETSKYLQIDTEFLFTSASYGNNDLKGQDRVIDICRREKATAYVNPIGGMELYNKADFGRSGIKLNFLKTGNISYKQFNDNFVPWLSIIDVLMFNSNEAVKTFLNEYELV
jgi:hypothetical protein